MNPNLEKKFLMAFFFSFFAAHPEKHLFFFSSQCIITGCADLVENAVYLLLLSFFTSVVTYSR